MRIHATPLLLIATACSPEQAFRSIVDRPSVPNPRNIEAAWQVDRFVQTPRSVVDVLFVVDNSCSMKEEQEKLGVNFPIFLDWFLQSGTEYHLGVISTDMEDPEHSGQLRTSHDYRWIDPETRWPEDVFREMVWMGNSGSREERGRAAIYTALELNPEGANDGFRRADAALSIVVISDEDDKSTHDPVSYVEFVAWLDQQRILSDDNVSFSSIVTPIGIFGPNQEEEGDQYIGLTDAFGGVAWDIREPEWSGVLDLLGIAALGLTREFELSRRPVLDTLRVSWTPPEAGQEVVATDFAYDAIRNSITLPNDIPPPQARIQLTYQVLSTGG